MSAPIDLYFWPTPNGHKVSIALEEMGLPYRIQPVNIGTGEQFNPDFLRISPNNRMPAIVDPEPAGGGEPLTIFESGAILIYLANKTGRFDGGTDLRAKVEVVQWLMWQMGGFGPMLGQAHHFRNYASAMTPDQRALAYGVARYTNEAHRLYGVLDRRLADRDYVAGDYSIADMAIWPWAVPHRIQGVDLAEFPNVKAWFDRLAERPAVQAGRVVGLELTNRNLAASGQDAQAARAVLFGQRARR